jgi:hypothetical protein
MKWRASEARVGMPSARSDSTACVSGAMQKSAMPTDAASSALTTSAPKPSTTSANTDAPATVRFFEVATPRMPKRLAPMRPAQTASAAIHARSSSARPAPPALRYATGAAATLSVARRLPAAAFRPATCALIAEGGLGQSARVASLGSPRTPP